VQEQGVDEEDLIKSDGTHAYTLDPAPAVLDGINGRQSRWTCTA